MSRGKYLKRIWDLRDTSEVCSAYLTAVKDFAETLPARRSSEAAKFPGDGAIPIINSLPTSRAAAL